MNSFIEYGVSAVASLLGPPLRIAHDAASPVVRMARLALLRGRVRGEVPATTRFDGAVHAVGRPRIDLGRACRLGRDTHLETGPEGRIVLGANVRLSAGVHIVSYAEILIGDDCLIGEYTSIRDANHGMEQGRPYRVQSHRSAPIRIGRNVWIGRGSVILDGVSIGDNSVVGANSVVARNVESGVLVAGVPIRVLRAVTQNDREQLARASDAMPRSV